MQDIGEIFDIPWIDRHPNSRRYNARSTNVAIASTDILLARARNRVRK